MSHTPEWVFALFAGLLVLRLLQARSRNVRTTLAYLLPVCMVASSQSGIESSFGVKPVPLAAWAIGLTMIAFLGYNVFPHKGISFNTANGCFFIPRSWVPLVVIMAIFSTKYAFAVMQGFGAEAARTPMTALVFSLVYGCLSGYFVARAASLVAAARKASQSAA